MAYTTASKIRSLTDLTAQEVTDEELTEHVIPAAENIVDFETGRTWTSSDENYEIASLAATWLAAWLIHQKLLDSKKADEYHRLALQQLDNLIGPGGPLTYDEQ